MRNVEELIGVTNVAGMLEDTERTEISNLVFQGYEVDEQSRTDWKAKNTEAVKLAEQVWEKKDFPIENAANVKYPLIATASIQFAARAYPNFVKAPNVVKGLVIGDDPDGQKAAKALRIGQHMSYQYLNEMEEWEEDTDRLLMYIPVVGCAFKKTYFSKVLQRNVSEFRRAEDIVINYWAKSMQRAPRITDQFTLYPNEIEERIRSGMYIKFEYGMAMSTDRDDKQVASNDRDQPHVFLEQHTLLDLDHDGYKEPYIVTFHKDTKKVVRIVARFKEGAIERNVSNTISVITPDHYFTKFSFIPPLDGSIYDAGFGGLLSPINSTINTLINQLLDSGTMYNLNAGFLGRGIQLGRGRGGGAVDFAPNEWKQLLFTGDDLRKNIFPLPVKEPSLVLFQLLGFMVQAGERLSSVTEILTGDQSNEAERPTTTLARIEQGLKVFSAIHKRLYRSFKEEHKKNFKLNHEYLQPTSYFTVLDNPMAIPREDYDTESCDVVPIADPNETTSTEKLIKAQIWMSMKRQGFNDQEINRRFAEAMQEPEPGKLLEQPQALPDPKIVLEQQKLELETAKFQFDIMKFASEDEERQAKIAALMAKAMDSMAKAESYEPGRQLDIYKAELKAITDQFKAEQAAKKQVQQQGGSNATAGST